MKLITSLKSISGLKVLLAAEFQNVPVEVEIVPETNKITFVAAENVRLFSANSAVWYIFCLSGHKRANTLVDKWLAWESTNSPTAKVDANVLKSLNESLHSKYLCGVNSFGKSPMFSYSTIVSFLEYIDSRRHCCIYCPATLCTSIRKCSKCSEVV